MSNAANVLSAKCRSKYGNRIGLAEISSLLGCRTTTEIAAFLRKSPRYGEKFLKLDERAVHRQRMEAELVAQPYDDMASLGMYKLGLGDWFSGYMIMRGEISQLLQYLRLLAAGRPAEYIFALPEFFAGFQKLNLESLASAKSYDEFLRLIEGTRYHKILKVFSPIDNKIDYALIEHALYSYFYNHIFDMIHHKFKGKEQREIHDLFGTMVDLQNFSHIYRLKRFYNADQDTCRTMISPHYHKITKKIMASLINAPDADTALKIFTKKTPYGKKIDPEAAANGYLTFAIHRILAIKSLRLLRFSVYPSSVVVGYLRLAELESQDLTTIIEGIRYAVSPDEIRKLIVIDKYD